MSETPRLEEDPPVVSAGSEPAPAPTGDGLAARTLHGLKWTYTATIVVAVFQIIYAAVMARLLDPAAFGLLAMAGVVLRFGTYFATMGVGPALIQKQHITDDDIRASFGFSIVMGVAVFAIFWLIAPVGARLFADPQVTPVVRVMALAMVLEGFYITSLSLLRRQMRFGTLAAIEIFAYACVNLVVAVTLALRGLGVWSLVLSTLAQNATAAVLYYLAVRHPLQPIFRWRTYRQLIGFGGRFSLNNFIQFLYYAIQPLAIGRFLGAESLGYFSNAQRVVNLPFEFFINALNRVMFPSFSRTQTDPARMKRLFLSSFTVVAVIFFPVAYGMIPAANEIVLVLLGPQWTTSIGVAQILLVAVPFSFLNSLNGVSIDARGRLTVKTGVDGSAILLLLALVIAASTSLSLFGMVACYALLEVLRFAAYFGFVTRLLALRFTDLYPVGLAIVRNTAAVVVAIGSVHLTFATLGALAVVTLAAEILVGALVFILVTFVRSPAPVKTQVENIYTRLMSPTGASTRQARIMQWLAVHILHIRPSLIPLAEKMER